jgi:hypothetical protein
VHMPLPLQGLILMPVELIIETSSCYFTSTFVFFTYYGYGNMRAKKLIELKLSVYLKL